MIHDQTKKIAWNVLEHEHRDRKPDWFWGIGIATIAGVVISALTKNFLLAFLILVSGILLIVFSLEKPKNISVEISDEGIKINNALYRFDTLKSFWLLKTAGGRLKLSITSSRAFLPMFTIPLAETVDPVILRDELLKHIPEEERQESFADQLAERIGF